MEKLIAVSHVLFENASYEPGDELPTHNAEFVGLWTGNGTAVWKCTEEPKKRGAKAKRAAAPAGLPGDAYPFSGPGQDLVGKQPARETRSAPLEPARGRRKSSA